MKAKVYISKRESKTQSVIIRISFGAYLDDAGKKRYRPIEYYTGLTVERKNFKDGLIKNNSYANGMLNNAIIRISEIHSRLKFEQNLTYDTFKKELQTDDELNKILQKDIRVTESNTEHYIPPYEYLYSRIEMSTVSAGTKKDYENTLYHMKNLEEVSGKPFSWKSAGVEYYLELVEYLRDENLRDSTIDKVVKNLKVFLNWADLADNIQVNQDFKKKIGNKSLFAKVNTDDSAKIYLNEDEVNQITNVQIDDSKLSVIRDLFVIGCWTGLRISDLFRLRRANIQDDIITITTKKTNTRVAIPVSKELKAMLDKYPDELPTPPSFGHYNREIKKVCECAGINEPVLQDIRKGSLKTVASVAKYTLVSSHTARRSFATNFYRRGISMPQLMKITGHKTEKAFLQYIGVTVEDNARDMAKQLKQIG